MCNGLYLSLEHSSGALRIPVTYYFSFSIYIRFYISYPIPNAWSNRLKMLQKGIHDSCLINNVMSYTFHIHLYSYYALFLMYCIKAISYIINPIVK